MSKASTATVTDSGEARRRCPPTIRTLDRVMTPAARIARSTLHTVESTPEREALLRRAIELLERTPTEVLIAYLPVLGKWTYGGTHLKAISPDDCA